MNKTSHTTIKGLAQRKLPSHDQLTENELMTQIYQAKPSRGHVPSKEELDELFVYKDGMLFWRHGLDNQVNAGDEAGGVNTCGYVSVSIKDRKYPVHRLIWVMHENEPVEFIDHINRDRRDNRIENLRAATNAENTRNAGIRKDNTSGVKGVSWRRQNRKWSGKVCFQGQQYHAGYFETKEECAKAVQELRNRLHGEFACHASVASEGQQ